MLLVRRIAAALPLLDPGIDIFQFCVPHLEASVEQRAIGENGGASHSKRADGSSGLHNGGCGTGGHGRGGHDVWYRNEGVWVVTASDDGCGSAV